MSELSDCQHTNKVQAEEIGRLKSLVKDTELRALKAETSLLIARQKHAGLLKEFHAFKSLIRHLGSTGTEIEWQEEPE